MQPESLRSRRDRPTPRREVSARGTSTYYCGGAVLLQGRGEKVVGDLAFRYSRLGDQFLDMAGGEGEDTVAVETFSTKNGSVESLKVRVRWGWTAKA
jgi:hypothetical protein